MASLQEPCAEIWGKPQGLHMSLEDSQFPETHEVYTWWKSLDNPSIYELFQLDQTHVECIFPLLS